MGESEATLTLEQDGYPLYSTFPFVARGLRERVVGSKLCSFCTVLTHAKTVTHLHFFDQLCKAIVPKNLQIFNDIGALSSIVCCIMFAVVAERGAKWGPSHVGPSLRVAGKD